MTEMPEFFIRLTFFVYGLCIGSFMNVCIYRIPAKESLIRPRSSCPNCGVPIKFYDNIPVISFLFLLGKCRSCKKSISIRYPLVELFTGLLWLLCYMKFGFTGECITLIIFLSTLVVITFIDMDHRIIPDIISLPGIPLFFLLSVYFTTMGWKESLFGILLGGGSLLIVAEGYYLITKNEGMGGGDIKLLAMIGAMIGWKGVFFTIFASSAIGTLIGLIVIISTKNTLKFAVPFGPFLSLGAAIYVFMGDEIIRWYYGFSGIPL
ncbi:MAG: prepilin peptidase [Proteobacteria bacterium]|nr:prepilin peptidase [Pseudomonadota bacterium]